MSDIVNGILNSTVGLLVSKIRDYTAERLDEGDVIDTQFRQIVVREIDDIKSKLDGLSRKDLLASLSNFKEGVTRLCISLETSGESRDQASTSKTHLEDESEVEGATATRVLQFPVTKAERDVVESAIALSRAIGNLKIASKERYKSAKKSFEEAKKLATEAFSNVALSTEDRLMASKLRIASRILDGLEDPEAAVHDCLLYLKELQDLPAVQAIISVWKDSDKGITSRLRARFYKEQRNVTIESIQIINKLLLDLTMKFTNIKMGLYNWPTIKTGMTFYHPLLDDHALKQKIEENETQVPWFWKVHTDIYCFDTNALTSKGEILWRTTFTSLTIIRISGESELFCTIPKETNMDSILGYAVGDNDNVYIVVVFHTLAGKFRRRYKLLTVDANGNVKADRFLYIVETRTFENFPKMSVTKDGTIVIYSRLTKTMYMCDSTNTREDYKFLLQDVDYKFQISSTTGHPETTEFSITVSNKNEIIFTVLKKEQQFFIMFIITMNGKLKRALKVPVSIHTKDSFSEDRLSVAFNHVNETIFVSCVQGSFDKPYTTIFNFSNTGELLRQFNILDSHLQVMAHLKGPIALAGFDKEFLLQM